MLPWMKRQREAASATARRPARVPEGQRVYAVGDIHGRADLLHELLELIRHDAAGTDRRCTVVFLGDYVDRGPDNSEVIDLLAGEPLPGFDALHLVGNHEAVFLQFLRDAEIGRDWLRFGGDATLRSYGVRIRSSNPPIDELLEAKAALARNLPRRHLQFLRGLRLSCSIGDYFFVHAGVRPGVPLDQQDGNDMIWIRDLFLNSEMDFGKVVVHGHTPDEFVHNLPNRIGIDTGAYFTGHLTAAVLEGEERRFLST